MDPSALIFVALAVAWAVYLIPKALEHHDEGVRTRTVERFSATMRILGRREPVSRRRARLVPTTSSDASGRNPTPQNLPEASLDEPPAPSPVELRARRRAAALAAKRRLRVVTLILVVNVVVAALGVFHVLAWRWAIAPVAVLAVWLVACRLMVRRERSQRPGRRIPAQTDPEPARDETEEIAAVPAEAGPGARDPDSWDPVPVTLPTYVTKAVAPRSVRTIDLDSTGVWSSGRSDADSELVREASARHDSARQDVVPPASRRRAVGD